MTIFELLKDSNPKECEKISKIIDNSNNAKKMIVCFQKSILSNKAQISYGTNGNSITIIDLTNGDMANFEAGILSMNRLKENVI
tara:strand:- start:236 stop:487 length:252 start_codon:yes stop_codon:yes gene_type:complete